MPSGGDDSERGNGSKGVDSSGNSSKGGGGWGGGTSGNANSPNAGGGYTGGGKSSGTSRGGMDAGARSGKDDSPAGGGVSGGRVGDGAPQGNSNSPNAGGGKDVGRGPSMSISDGRVTRAETNFDARTTGGFGPAITRGMGAAVDGSSPGTSFDALTRGMGAPAMGFMSGPTPTYDRNSMAYATDRPTNYMSALTEPTRVRSSFVDARGVTPMSNASFAAGSLKAPTQDYLENYIRQGAVARGLNPDDAVAVAIEEGLRADPKTGWASTIRQKNGQLEPSYGVYQLHDKYVGKDFTKATGLKASDPKSVYAAIDFALDRAAKKGWGEWYGAPKAGVSNEVKGAKAIGISQAALDYASGKPSGPVNASSMQAYAPGKTPNVTEFAATPQTGPSIETNRNTAIAANRMDANKATAKTFADKYLSAMVENYAAYANRPDGPAAPTATAQLSSTQIERQRDFRTSYTESLPPGAVAGPYTGPMQGYGPTAPTAAQSPAVAAINAISPTDLEDRPVDAVEQGAKAITEISRTTGVPVSVKDEEDLATLNPSIVDTVARAAAATEYGAITITSTHRNAAQNRGVGGLVNSYHTQLDANGKARAVDVRTRNNTRAEAKALANEINKTPGLRAIVEYDHVHVQMETQIAAQTPQTGPMPTPRGQMAVASSTAPVSATAPNYSNPPVPGLQPVSTADAPNSIPATSVASTADATPPASTVPSSDFPPKPNAPLGPVGKGFATAIDAGIFAIPGIGTFAGLANGAITLTGRQSFGTMMVEDFLSGNNKGTGPRDENATVGEDPFKGQEEDDVKVEEDTAPTVKFVEKYIKPVKKFPTPQEKWGSRTYSPTAA